MVFRSLRRATGLLKKAGAKTFYIFPLAHARAPARTRALHACICTRAWNFSPDYGTYHLLQ